MLGKTDESSAASWPRDTETGRREAQLFPGPQKTHLHKARETQGWVGNQIELRGAGGHSVWAPLRLSSAQPQLQVWNPGWWTNTTTIFRQSKPLPRGVGHVSDAVENCREITTGYMGGRRRQGKRWTLLISGGTSLGKMDRKGTKKSLSHVQPSNWYTCQTFSVPDQCSLSYLLTKLCGFSVGALCGQLYVYLLYEFACEYVLSFAHGWTLAHELLLHCKIWACPSNKEVVPGYRWSTASFNINQCWLVNILGFWSAHLCFVVEEEQSAFSDKNNHPGSDANFSLIWKPCLQEWHNSLCFRKSARHECGVLPQ